MSAPKTTICFDLDGTLVNTAPDLFAALDHALSLKGYSPANKDSIRPIIGHGAKAMIIRAISGQNSQIDNIELDELWHNLIDHYANHIADQSHPFDGAEGSLTTLKAQGHSLTIITNKTMDLTEKLLDALNLSHYFTAITGADSFDFKKPDPRHLFETIKLAGGSNNQAIMVGDSKTDIETAIAANIPVIGVNWGYTDIPMADLKPNIIISHFDGLEAAIKSLTN